jgi:hypothetical protein
MKGTVKIPAGDAAWMTTPLGEAFPGVEASDVELVCAAGHGLVVLEAKVCACGGRSPRERW